MTIGKHAPQYRLRAKLPYTSAYPTLHHGSPVRLADSLIKTQSVAISCAQIQRLLNKSIKQVDDVAWVKSAGANMEFAPAANRD